MGILKKKKVEIIMAEITDEMLDAGVKVLQGTTLGSDAKNTVRAIFQSMSKLYSAPNMPRQQIEAHDDLTSFIGTKIVNAKAMTRGIYNQMRGWTLPADENGADEGYLVEYTDAQRPNVDGYQGFVSWSPKDVFESAYTEYKTTAIHPNGEVVVPMELANGMGMGDKGTIDGN